MRRSATDGWDPRRVPRQDGRVVVVTGASSGIGFWAADQLAAAGARVVLLCRDRGRADRALAALRERVPGADVDAPVLADLADLDAVRRAAAALGELGRLDALVSNAGLVDVAGRSVAGADGLDRAVVTNVLGPFLLTRLLLPVLARSGTAERPARVAAMGSMSARLVRVRRDDLGLRGGASAWRAYGQSKALGQALGFELQRRLDAAGEPRVLSTVAHPGYAISATDPPVPGVVPTDRTPVDRLETLFAQSKEQGAWPIVRATTDPGATAGAFFGPRGPMRGAPTSHGGLGGSARGLTSPAPQTLDPRLGRRAWDWASAAIGVGTDLGADLGADLDGGPRPR